MVNDVLVLISKNELIGKYYSKHGLAVEDVWRNNHFSRRKYSILKLFGKVDLLYGFNKDIIKKYNKIIIAQTNGISDIVMDIKKWNPKAIIKYWLWDPVKSYPYGKIEELSKLSVMGIDCYSFDKDDCIKYKLKYNNNLYPYDIEVSMDEQIDVKKSKVLFFGSNKGRLNKVVKVRDALLHNNIEYDFTVLSKNITYIKKYPDIRFLDKPVKYENIIRKINESGCILDIVQEGQSGLTWRPFEALFYNKKLITTNKCIKEFDFYNKNNILVLENNYDEIKDFLALPYIIIDEKIKNNYMLEQWVNNFFK